MLVVGLAVFAVGSVVSAVSPSVGLMLVSRGVTGIGAARVLPGTLSILLHVFPPAERPHAVATYHGSISSVTKRASANRNSDVSAEGFARGPLAVQPRGDVDVGKGGDSVRNSSSFDGMRCNIAHALQAIGDEWSSPMSHRARRGAPSLSREPAP